MRYPAMNIPRLLAAACVFASFAVCAQEWPSKPIRLVIPYVAGGAGDITFRTLMPAVEAKLGQRFVIDNKAGASGNVGAADVMRAAPDGHTLLLGATNNFATNQYLMKGMDFDPITAFAPGLFSTITGWRNTSCSFGARMRAVTSEDPPEYGTMMRIGLLGNALGGTGCACAAAVKRKSAPEAIALRIVIMLFFIVRLPETALRYLLATDCA